MKKEDEKFITLLAENMSIKVVEKFIEKLPCEKHNNRIATNENILQNGLPDKVERLRKNSRWLLRMLVGLLIILALKETLLMVI